MIVQRCQRPLMHHGDRCTQIAARKLNPDIVGPSEAARYLPGIMIKSARDPKTTEARFWKELGRASVQDVQPLHCQVTAGP